MRYEEFHPNPPLDKFIKCIWSLESAAQHQHCPERILPDGCTEMVFHLADPFDQHNDDGSQARQPAALLVGQMRGHLLIQPTGRVRVLGVRFRPGGAYPFLSIPQSEITGRVIALDSIWGAIAVELHSRIADATTNAESVRHLEKILSETLKSRRLDDRFSYAVDLITNSGGSVPIDRLANDLGVSFRSLDRIFNTRVGLSPKTLCRIVRFQSVFKLLERESSKQDWVRIALDGGYYDQAHFVKEFREFSGKTPTAYFGEQNAMSDLFIASS
jgi:methylphosphotriester-DNA--protein-cysteine methyltransferase